MALAGRKIPPDVERRILDLVREGKRPGEVALLTDVNIRTVWRVRREYGLLTPRTGPRRKAFLLLDAVLVPALAAIRSLPQAERRARQLQLARVGNDPNRLTA